MKLDSEYPFLKRWTRPSNYAGCEWPDYYSAGVGRSRDSQPLERANFDAMLKALGGERNHPDIEDPNDEGAALSLVRIIRENHWAVGWVEWIAIHESQVETLAVANRLMEKMEDYPVIDENLFSEYENTEANEVWRDCYRTKERIEYIRKHKSQFEFRDFQDLIGCVRGKYFAGYASELLH